MVSMASGKLLIVDDNALVRQMIASLARELGLFVIEAASIDAAQAPLADGDIDMLLCDDDLGNGRSGMEFIASDSARMPATVVLMSGNPKPDTLPDGIRYLCKPFTIGQLEGELLA
jgi:CheY-like chemotaxis protein